MKSVDILQDNLCSLWQRCECPRDLWRERGLVFWLQRTPTTTATQLQLQSRFVSLWQSNLELRRSHLWRKFIHCRSCKMKFKLNYSNNTNFVSYFQSSYDANTFSDTLYRENAGSLVRKVRKPAIIDDSVDDATSVEFKTSFLTSNLPYGSRWLLFKQFWTDRH